MYCPKCATENDNNELHCKNCGLDFTTIYNSNTNIPSDSISNNNKLIIPDSLQKKHNTSITYLLRVCIYTVLAIVVIIMFFISANQISEAGKNIMRIQSVGGKTLEEAYYYELGTIYSAYSTISRALGLSLAAVLMWLGIKKR